MIDICLCSPNDCPLRDSCYRATAQPDLRWQSYAAFDWHLDEESNPVCEDYLPHSWLKQDGEDATG